MGIFEGIVKLTEFGRGTRRRDAHLQGCAQSIAIGSHRRRPGHREPISLSTYGTAEPSTMPPD
jgi:hypothetical protein